MYSPQLLHRMEKGAMRRMTCCWFLSFNRRRGILDGSKSGGKYYREDIRQHKFALIKTKSRLAQVEPKSVSVARWTGEHACRVLVRIGSPPHHANGRGSTPRDSIIAG